VAREKLKDRNEVNHITLQSEPCTRLRLVKLFCQIYLSIYISIYLSIYLSNSLEPFVGPRPLFQFLSLFTQSTGLLGRGISQSQGRYLHTDQHKHRIIVHRHPCLEWDLNPRPQCMSRRKQLLRLYDAATVMGILPYRTSKVAAR
jgi:hypothetical protein